jgi:hypothetical protein
MSGAVMAGLAPAIHAAGRDKSFARSDFLSSGAYAEAEVFWWMAGSSPAMTEKQNPNPNPHLTLLELSNLFRYVKNNSKDWTV